MKFVLIALLAYLPAALAGCMMYDEAHCLNCMMMNGTCSEMGMNAEMNMCKNQKECLACHWTDNMCMPISGGGGGGQMVMTFYTGHEVVILFNEWNITSRGMYAFACILTIVGCALITMLKDFVTHSSLHLAIRSLLMFGVFAGLYAAMLVTMTYNTGLFLSVIAGLTLGWTFNEAVRLHKLKLLGDNGDINDGEKKCLLRQDVSCH
eukprot:TRINITY_DN1668_c11_g1_i1.p1 TRINITY_DN1668_c11_g1~~TRINITY_DN1668_c11_g1_i1.p1  ORF type:complete len:207 (+),score=46.27 TRINITY_DN1668_c11_g1_i1:70-690(+)